jgi:hypothetical protein
MNRLVLKTTCVQALTVEAERRRSRTDRAVGYTTALVLKTSWATGPITNGFVRLLGDHVAEGDLRRVRKRGLPQRGEVLTLARRGFGGGRDGRDVWAASGGTLRGLRLFLLTSKAARAQRQRVAAWASARADHRVPSTGHSGRLRRCDRLRADCPSTSAPAPGRIARHTRRYASSSIRR